MTLQHMSTAQSAALLSQRRVTPNRANCCGLTVQTIRMTGFAEPVLVSSLQEATN